MALLGVAPCITGEGRVHACLRFNRDKISEKCAAEEAKLQATEYRDIRLRPRLNKLCSEEKAVYCKVRLVPNVCCLAMVMHGVTSLWIGQ